MNIDRVSLQNKPFFKADMPDQAQVEEIQQPLDDTEIEEPSPTEPESDVQQVNDSEHPRGVLRLLQEGHFKGVADVRLRINFHDELTALESQKLQAVAEENISGVLESVGTVVDSFLTGENKPPDEQTAAISELQETFIEAASGNNSESIAGINTAFEDFTEALRNLFAPQVTTQEQDITSDTENNETTELPWQTFIEDLQSAFEAAMDELTQTLGEVQILPELSEPNGNGVAYEKFLTIYNELHGLQTPIDDQQNGELLNLSV